MDKLKELLAKVDSISEWTSEEVTDARTALAEFTQAVKAGEVDAPSDAIAEAKTFAEALTERESAIAAEVEARQAQIAALEESLGMVAQEEDPDEDEDEDEDNGEEAVVPDTPAEIVEEELVTASAEKTAVTISALAKAVPKERKPQPVDPQNAMVASGSNAVIASAKDYGKQVFSKIQSAPMSKTPIKIGSFESKHKYEFTTDPAHNVSVLSDLTADAVENGNLVASGGRCAPAEVSYGFFNIATRAGLGTLPTANAPRGAVSIPVSPSLGDFLNQPGIGGPEWTNENDETPSSPATKAVFRIECPDFQECEVSAWPTILEWGNFQGRFFPESIANATALATVAASRELNQARFAFLRSVASNLAATNTGGGGIISVAHNISEYAGFYRRTYGLGPDAVLDAFIPAWVPKALYVDGIARQSTQDSGDNFASIFAEINVRPQFVYDLDDGATYQNEWDGSADIILMAPGTVVELDGGTLDLGIVRDSTLNSTNDVQSFVEQFVGWCQPGHEVYLINDVPVLTTGLTGQTGAVT